MIERCKNIVSNSSLHLLVSVCILFVLSLIGCSKNSVKSSGETETELRKLTHEFNRAILEQDEQTLENLLATEYMWGYEKLYSKKEHISILISRPSPKKQTVDNIHIQIYGDTAIVTGIATSTVTEAKDIDPMEQKFRWVNVWSKRDAGWQVIYNQSTILSITKIKPSIKESV